MILCIEMGSRASLSIFRRAVEVKAEFVFLFTKDEYYRCWFFSWWQEAINSMLPSRYFEKSNAKLFLQGKIDILTYTWESICFSEETNVMERTFWKHV